MNARYAIILYLSGLMSPWVYAETSPMANQVNGEDIVRHCNYKNAGTDQRSRLTIILKKQSGEARRNVYLRLWKAYDGKQGIAEKMLLFTEFPPDAEGVSFMRWAYVPGKKKSARQWIFLPKLKKIRRISVRDLNESFLGSDLTYGDISPRNVDQDTHRFLKIMNGRDGDYFLVESTPKEKNSMYSKRIQWFQRTPRWETCVNLRVDYFDRKGDLLKHQYLHWQKVNGAWVWDRMLVENVQSYHTSMFIIDNVEINVGLKDKQFTERNLRSPRH